MTSVLPLCDRIRRARTLSRMSQQALAEAVGVQRGAVAQWERTHGSHPSMHHLVEIAIATGVCLEWLGTGRGPIHPAEDSWTPAVNIGDYAHDDIEAQCLASLRRIPSRVREQVAGIIGLVAANYPKE
ncbi:helix-turn-helix transcriptional regulator [Marilutibacter alkalisoli]|uniref:Helix-turn-helix transcriptional regulator n=1 Tax=Marilutibacter alkalisoli TaxID=2591633 RepID=A0A514BWR6_9GAMM|nr:helix-turn-helix transcriptional regulator [Lysobacter alkalisoli]QDH71841.1 helix-turn-helix transcriptional regulator [Lysobacter alkalisoli]